MSKQVLLDKVSNYTSFIKSFLDEYRDESHSENEEKLTNLLEDIIQNITNKSIPDLLYERISKLVDTLNIHELMRRQQSQNNRHDFKVYKDLFENVISKSSFVAKAYYLLKAIGFVNSNVVLIGANGSGKTTFANSIRNELERTENGIVLPAQKLLIFPTYSFVPTYKSAYAIYEQREKEILDNKQTYDTSNNNDLPYNLIRRYGAEMSILVSTLMGERIARRNCYCSTVNDGDIVDTKKFRSSLDEIIEIWNNLIEHRKLFCDDSENLQIEYENKTYPAYKMSDGEREIFYVVGRIILAKKSSLIIIDEPELHLHKAILNKLWDILEKKRNDCMFIYLTHDIDFASSRIATKCWLKSYFADATIQWEVEPITDNEIPEPLLMKLLGSRKRVLFCEGKKNSLDWKIFEIIFPNYTITPVDTCKDVINYTKAFNKITKKYAEAFGIIDRDFRVKVQLEEFKTEKIFSYNVAEIENLFLIEDFIKGFARYKNEQCDITEIKKKIMKRFGEDVEQQVSSYVISKIDYRFKETHVKRGKNKDEVEKSYSDFIGEIQIGDWFAKRKIEMEEIVSRNDYDKAILVYNNKGLHTVIEQAFGISPYNQKALEYLKNSEGAQQILRKVFPPEL